MKWWKTKKNKQIIIKWICWRCLPNLIGIGLVEEGEIKKKKYQIDRWFNVHFHPKLFCFCVQNETQSAVNLTFPFWLLILFSPKVHFFTFTFLNIYFCSVFVRRVILCAGAVIMQNCWSESGETGRSALRPIFAK